MLTARYRTSRACLRSLLVLVAAFGLAVVGLALSAPPALAHAVLAGTTPEDEAELEAVPETITLEFSEDIQELGAQAVVEGPDGDVQDGEIRVDGVEVHQDLAPQAPAGDYAVTWRVTSADGHPISGEFTFTALEGAGDAETPESTGTSTPSETTEPAGTPTPSPTDTEAPSEPVSETTAADDIAATADQPGDEDGGVGTGLLIGIGVAVLAAGAGAIALVGRSRD